MSPTTTVRTITLGLTVAATFGCGRIGYDPLPPLPVASVDSAVADTSAGMEADVATASENGAADAVQDAAQDAAQDAPVDQDAGQPCDGTYFIVVPDVADTYLDSVNPTFNYGAANDLDVTQLGGALLEFDSARIPAQTIHSASISVILTQTDAPAGTYGLTINQIASTNAGWGEGVGNGSVGGAGESTYAYRDQGGAVAWTGPWGASCGSNCSAILSTTNVTVPLSRQRIDFAIFQVSVVDGWRNAPGSNTGVVLNEHIGSHWHFVSREGADPSERPQLRVEIDCP